MAFKSTSVNGTNVAILDQSGKVGTIRYYVRNGRTYVRAAANKTTAKTNPRTDKQMQTRLKHASMLAIWKKLQPYMEGAFQNKESNQTDYNAFLQQNAGTGAYFTKQQYADGYGIALPVVVSNGSLPELVCAVAENKCMFGINHTTDLSGTVGDLSADILANNDGWEDGDTITALVLSQDSSNKLKVSALQLVIDPTSAISINSTGFVVADNKLGIPVSSTEDYCIGFIHGSSNGMSKCKLLNKNEAKITEFTSAAQFQLARDSYGKATKLFLKNGTTAGSTTTTYSVTAEISPEGAGSVAGLGNYPEGSTVTLTANPGSGYVFQKWSDNVSTATRSVTVDSDKQFTAMFMLDD